MLLDPKVNGNAFSGKGLLLQSAKGRINTGEWGSYRKYINKRLSSH